MKNIQVVTVCATILIAVWIWRHGGQTPPPSVPPGSGESIDSAIERERAMANERDRIEKERLAAIQREQARMRSAMEAVMAKDRELSARQRTRVSEGAKPADAIATYASAVKNLDMSQCPSEFREAYLRHANAWQDMAAQLAKEPDGVVEGVLQGFLNSLGGEFDGGAARMQRERDSRYQSIKSTWVEVEAIAVRHGARLNGQ